MARKLFIFEDHKYDQFLPLTYNRPVCELLCGASKIKNKIGSLFGEAEVVLLCRDHLQKVLKLSTGKKVNVFDAEPDDEILLINGRILPSVDFPKEIGFSRKERSFFSGDDMVAWLGPGKAFAGLRGSFDRLHLTDQVSLLRSKLDSTQSKVEMVSYLWDLVRRNADEIEADFEKIKPQADFKNMLRYSQVDGQALIYDANRVYIGKGAQVDGQVVLDARQGAIIVEEGVRIQSHTRVEGPCYIGQGSILVGGKIRAGTSIGPYCRIGGEVEGSIFLGYSNKYHEGFLGHSYVGQWVNLGASTTNSDLKNNYGSVRVMVNGTLVDSGQMKVGAFIGDHAKTGIGTLLNTGVCLGFASNLFGGGMIGQKYIPSFFWGTAEKGETYQLDRAIETAGAVMARRDEKLSPDDADLFKKIFQLTEKERRD